MEQTHDEWCAAVQEAVRTCRAPVSGIDRPPVLHAGHHDHGEGAKLRPIKYAPTMIAITMVASISSI
jgi:hypothetical protein